MSLRIIGGAFRGRTLQVPPGETTRPTSARARQSLFDMLMHAPWAGRSLLDGAAVLDGFAGSGALGLEALSRGAAHVVFVERDPAAGAAIAANIAACKAEDRSTLLRCDIGRLPEGAAKTLVFLDPPYGKGLLPAGVAVLRQRGWIDPTTIIVAETGQKDKISPDAQEIARTTHGAAQMVVWRESFA